MIIISFHRICLHVFSEMAFFLGKVPLSPILQAVILVVSYGIPNAFLQVLPTTIIAAISPMPTFLKPIKTKRECFSA